MNYEGVLTKMQTENGLPIQYYLIFEDDFLNVTNYWTKRFPLIFYDINA